MILISVVILILGILELAFFTLKTKQGGDLI